MWDKYGVCECGYHIRVPFGDRRCIPVNVCPDYGGSTHEWRIKTARFVSTAVWWNPPTWSSGRWEYKEA